MNKQILDILCRWIKERYTVHLKKDVQKLPAPWSDWKIMQELRYTNVLRRHDKETEKIIRSTYENPELSIEEKILNAFVFRAYNKHETYALMGFPRKKEMVGEEELKILEKRILDKRAAQPNYCFCTSAFNTGGIKTCWGNYVPKGVPIQKTNLVESRFILLWNDLIKNCVAQKILACDTADKVGKEIRKVRGFAGIFLSFQVYVDLTYIPGFKYTEDDWAICGPGCRLGIDYLFGDEQLSIKEHGASHDELLYWTADHIDGILLENGVDLRELMTDLPLKDRRISLSNCENFFCELSKTCKYLFNEGRVRRKYSACVQESALF